MLAIEQLLTDLLTAVARRAVTGARVGRNVIA